MQPSDWNTARFASMTRRISGSTGTPPRFRHHATRAPFTFESSAAANRAGSSESESGLAALAPAMTLRNRATSATLRAIGPLVESGDQVDESDGTRPGVGRKPTTLQNAAGLRSEPPVSLPVAIGDIPHASATAAPPLLPPHVLPRSYGLRVAPKTVLNVCDPAPNSGVLVLPSVTAPARFTRATMSASLFGTLSL